MFFLAFHYNTFYCIPRIKVGIKVLRILKFLCRLLIFKFCMLSIPKWNKILCRLLYISNKL